ncbi:hypothetical protein [Leucobacter luti]|uniref:Bacteriocin biosynthesis cyclodehydratase domain-containing protein n=1 Tax=Leucobacter luti TaxID=340320 RepID=A0A4Q7TUH3_9MICO|nr:hypothetical protein [Leucobacter luti]MBL3698327.1 hypothetical protein [Leucobacter luti]RZT64585.1 hypothetical protein EV139_2003 [Leucobacter luti]
MSASHGGTAPATTPTLRIRPELPLSWEDPDTIRIGFDRAVARVARPSAAQQRLLGRLRLGLPAGQLHAQSREVGATPREARELLAAIASALQPGLAPGFDLTLGGAGGDGAVAGRRPVRVALSSGGRQVPGFAQLLADSRVCVLDRDAPQLVVYVERFLEPLERAQAWLMLDLPHLRVRFTDTQLSVGPLVVPPGAPCHTCATLHLVDRDPALPVIAAQLVGTVPASETRLVGMCAASTVATIIAAWARGDPAAQRTRLTFPVAHGRIRGGPVSETIAAHPECACGELAAAETTPPALPPGGTP